MIKTAMRSNKFEEFMRFIHLLDSTKLDDIDKMWKLRPLIDILKANFLSCGHLNYDESVIKYFGKHFREQIVKEKPIKLGYTAWCLSSENRCLVSFQIY